MNSFLKIFIILVLSVMPQSCGWEDEDEFKRPTLGNPSKIPVPEPEPKPAPVPEPEPKPAPVPEPEPVPIDGNNINEKSIAEIEILAKSEGSMTNDEAFKLELKPGIYHITEYNDKEWLIWIVGPENKTKNSYIKRSKDKFIEYKPTDDYGSLSWKVY